MLTKYKPSESGKPNHTFNKVLTPNSKGELRHYPRSDLHFQEEYMRGKKKNSTKLPFELVEHLVLTSSEEGDVVLDPFLGNGTTLAVCKSHNRKLIAFEINPNAREVIQNVIDGVH